MMNDDGDDANIESINKGWRIAQGLKKCGCHKFTELSPPTSSPFHWIIAWKFIEIASVAASNPITYICNADNLC